MALLINLWKMLITQISLEDFLNWPIPASFSLFLSFQYSWQKNININFCRWLDSNCGPLELEATALPTEPRLLPILSRFCRGIFYPSSPTYLPIFLPSFLTGYLNERNHDKQKLSSSQRQKKEWIRNLILVTFRWIFFWAILVLIKIIKSQQLYTYYLPIHYSNWCFSFCTLHNLCSMNANSTEAFSSNNCSNSVG